jgi:hypothetical protein
MSLTWPAPGMLAPPGGPGEVYRSVRQRPPEGLAREALPERGAMKLRTTAVAAVSVAALSLGTATTASAGTVQVDGTQLKAALLPLSDFPPGYAVSDAVDSGGRLEAAPAKYTVATMSCSSWEQEFSRQGFGETAVANDSVGPSSLNLAEVTGYGQLVYQFRTASAASSFFSRTRAIGGRCGSFSAHRGEVNVTVKIRVVTAPPVRGHTAFWIDQTISASSISGQADVLMTDVGTDVYGLESVGVGTAPPSSPSPARLIVKLIARVQALR